MADSGEPAGAAMRFFVASLQTGHECRGVLCASQQRAQRASRLRARERTWFFDRKALQTTQSRWGLSTCRDGSMTKGNSKSRPYWLIAFLFLWLTAICIRLFW